MPKHKKKFIDKKNAVTFRLVHRSQQDPLVADERAPQHVLLPLDKNTPTAVSQSQSKPNLEKQKEEQRKFGVFFDDEYNYLQHLRITNAAPAWEMIEERVVINKNDFPVQKEGKATINLPSSVFPSKVEEDVGMLNKAAPSSGPHPEWDPDVVAALDDALDLDDPDNLLDDDFVIQANQGASDDDQDDRSDFSSQFGSDDYRSSDMEDMEAHYFDEEETKSRFTEYSITSSVMRRNEGLQRLDNHFEKIYEQYDEEEIGALDDQEIEGYLNPDSEIFNAALKEYEKLKTEIKVKDAVKPCEDFIDEDVMNKDNLVEVNIDEEPKEKWDCESIISTYSNIYNHPKLISEPKKIHPLKISNRNGIPVEGLKSHQGLTKNKLQLLDSMNTETSDRCGSVAMSNVSKASTYRSKNETTEDRKLRKANIKTERQERRMEKKANKVAFKDEEQRQKKIMINLKNNLKAVSLT